MVVPSKEDVEMKNILMEQSMHKITQFVEIKQNAFRFRRSL